MTTTRQNTAQNSINPPVESHDDTFSELDVSAMTSPALLQELSTGIISRQDSLVLQNLLARSSVPKQANGTDDASKSSTYDFQARAGASPEKGFSDKLPGLGQETTMHLTALGAHLASSLLESPVSVRAQDPGVLLTSSKVTNGVASVQSVMSVDNSIAPSLKGHSAVWNDAIAAAKSTADGDVTHLDLYSNHIENVGLATLALDGALSTIPLSTVLGLVDLVPASARRLGQALIVSSTLDSPASSVPPGFVLSGDIKLFGGLDAQLYTFHGTADQGVSQMAILTQHDVSMDDLLNSEGISFGAIKLHEPVITYNTKQTVNGRDIGLWLDAGITLDGALGEVAQDMQNIFGSHSNTLKASAHIGGFQSLTAAFKPPPSFSLGVSVVALNANVGSFLTFFDTLITITGGRTQTPNATNGDVPSTPAKDAYKWSSSFSGQLQLLLAGSTVPTALKYTIDKADAMYLLRINAESIDTLLGVPGLHVQDVQFVARMQVGPVKDVSLDLSAALMAGSSIIYLKGSYARASDWEIHASLDNLDWSSLSALYKNMFKSPVHAFQHNISINGKLNVNSANKFITLSGSVKVDDYSSAKGIIVPDSRGFQLNASLEQVIFDHVTIDHAALDVFVGRQGVVDPDPTKPGTATKFTISGIVTYSGLTFSAVAYVENDPALGLLWVVYAKLTSSITLSKIKDLHISEDSLFNLGLRNIALIASNTDTLGDSMPQSLDYQVEKGFQLLAVIDCPPALSKAFGPHANAPATLTLQLDLATTAEKIDFIFAAPQSLNLKPGMVSPTVKAGLVLGTDPAIFIEGDLSIQLGGQPEPLKTNLTLAVHFEEAKISASLTTNWVNPFNVSKNVTIIAPLTLEGDIIYASSVYPSGLGFIGKIQIGKTVLGVAFDVEVNPKEGVLIVEADNIGIVDIVSFASQIVDRPLPQPSTDILFFEQFKLGISTGASIGGTFYPPGVTFKSNLIVFGEHAQVDCEITKDPAELRISGSCDPFTVGPLMVTGMTGPRPSLNILVSPSLQHVLVDGKIRVYDMDASIVLRAEMEPFDLLLDFNLDFSNALVFEVNGHVVGKLTGLKDVVKEDFSLYAKFEQHILDFIASHGNTYVVAGKLALENDTTAATAKLKAAQEAYNNLINQKTRELASARTLWEATSKTTTDAVKQRKDQIKAEDTRRRQDVVDAKARFDGKIQQLSGSLNNTKANAARQIADAAKKVIDAKSTADASVDGASRGLQRAEDNFSHSFGNADKSIQDAKSSVASAQRDLDGAKNQLEDAKNHVSSASLWDKPGWAIKVTQFGITVTAKETAFTIAQGILQAAQAIVSVPGYQLAKTGISVAQKALDVAKAGADASMTVANGTLAATQKTQDASISAAQATLDAAKTSCDELHVWQAVQKATDEWLAGEQKLLDAADAVLTELLKCAEKVVFDAANLALQVAKDATKELSVAQAGIDAVKTAGDAMLGFSGWLTKNSVNIFNVELVELHGSMNEAIDKKPFQAHLVGKFADKSVDYKFEFTPGDAEKFVKGILDQILADAKKDLKSFIRGI